jgi:uncharacterized protein Smg (DUF494 family)
MMKPKIIEVLAKILDGLSNNIPMEDVNKRLLKSKEYDEQTLSIAFSLVYDKLLLKRMHPSETEEEKSSGIRFLTEEEKEILGLDNINYLVHLHNVGLLDSAQMESILEQVAYYPDNSISRKDLNWLVLLSLVEIESDIPLGSRVLLYSSDSVN